VRVVEGDHAGVVFEDGKRERRFEFLRAVENRFFDQVAVAANRLAGFVHDFDGALERLVNAMLAPRLRDRLELDIARLTLGAAKYSWIAFISASERNEMSFAGKFCELLIAELADVDMFEREAIFVAGLELLRQIWVEMNRFDYTVGEDFGGDRLKLLARDLFLEKICAAGADFADLQAHVTESPFLWRRRRDP
jgi:hypothetical protein